MRRRVNLQIRMSAITRTRRRMFKLMKLGRGGWAGRQISGLENVKVGGSPL